jgi:hypothetical protein
VEGKRFLLKENTSKIVKNRPTLKELEAKWRKLSFELMKISEDTEKLPTTRGLTCWRHGLTLELLLVTSRPIVASPCILTYV